MNAASGPDLPAKGSCYGYEIRSELDFRYLRSGGGDPLEIAAEPPSEPSTGELLREWSPPLFPTHVRLYADDRGYRLWIDDAGWFGVDPETPRLTVPREGDAVRREERIWGLPVVLCFVNRGDVPFHAACVEIAGQALLLAAPRRFGKTTLAAAFAREGFRVLAEDLTCLRTGSPPTVLPGPAMLRLRPDVADAFELRDATEVRRDEDRVHLSLQGGRGTCDAVPLAGVVLLKIGDTAPRVEPVAGAEVVRDLWALSFNLPTDEDRERCFRAVARMAATTTTWNLTRRLRVEDLGTVVERLVETVRTSQPSRGGPGEP